VGVLGRRQLCGISAWFAGGMCESEGKRRCAHVGPAMAVVCVCMCVYVCLSWVEVSHKLAIVLPSLQYVTSLAIVWPSSHYALRACLRSLFWRLWVFWGRVRTGLRVMSTIIGLRGCFVLTPRVGSLDKSSTGLQTCCMACTAVGTNHSWQFSCKESAGT
jgi:hypothetical protein